MSKKNQPLTHWKKEFNKLTIGKTRYKVELTFGSVKRWFDVGQSKVQEN